MKKRAFILIILFIMISIPFISLSVNICSYENIQRDDVRITSALDSRDIFYLNPVHQMDFVFIDDNSIFLSPPHEFPFKNNLIPYKTASFIESPYKPPLSM